MAKLVDEIWVDHCVLCAMALRPRRPHLLCDYCWQDLPWLGPQCRHCAIPLIKSGVCGSCLGTPMFTGIAIAALQHHAEGQYLVNRLKFQHGYREARALGTALSFAVHLSYQPGELPGAIVATPMSWWRLAQRGFNQSNLLATRVAGNLNLPIICPLKRQHGPPQRTLSRAARHGLAANAFPARRKLGYRHVAVVDDVLTTGSTARAMSDALKALGARRVDVWCATRAVATVGNEHTL